MEAIKSLHFIEHKNTDYKILLVSDGCAYVESANGYKFIAKYNSLSLSITRAKLVLKTFIKIENNCK